MHLQENDDPLGYLRDMQCCWFTTERGNAHLFKADLPGALQDVRHVQKRSASKRRRIGGYDGAVMDVEEEEGRRAECKRKFVKMERGRKACVSTGDKKERQSAGKGKENESNVKE